MTDLETLREAYQNGGWIALAAVAVTIALRLYRKPQIQGLLPPTWQWKAMPLWMQWLVVFVCALVASWLGGIANGVPVWAALLAAVPVALGAICGHKVTKTLGHAHTDAQVEKHGLAYQPGSIRTALDLVFPLDHHKLGVNARLRKHAQRVQDNANGN